MKVVNILRAPFEAIAGEQYPDLRDVARGATIDGATGPEVDISVAYARHVWRQHLIHFDGLRRIIGRSE